MFLTINHYFFVSYGKVHARLSPFCSASSKAGVEGEGIVMDAMEKTNNRRPFVQPMDVINDPRLIQLCMKAKTSLAALCAQRLLDEESLLRVVDQSRFALSWLPVLQEIWDELEGVPSASRRGRIEKSYWTYLDGPYASPRTDDEAEQADNHAAAAAVYAVHVYLYGDLENLQGAIERLIEGAYSRLNAEERSEVSGIADIRAENAHQIVQDEVHLVLAALSVAEASPWSPELATSIHHLVPHMQNGRRME